MESHHDFIKRKSAEFEKELKRGRAIPMKDVSRQARHYWKREAWTFMPQHNVPEKVFVIERLRRIRTEGKPTHRQVKLGDIEYRLGYYIVGKIGNRKGKWTWGQFCPLIPQGDLQKLLDKAKTEGTIIS